MSKDDIQKLFDKFNDDLSMAGLEIDHHAEFVSLLKIKDTNEIVALLIGENEIDWEYENK